MKILEIKCLKNTNSKEKANAGICLVVKKYQQNIVVDILRLSKYFCHLTEPKMLKNRKGLKVQ